VHPRHCSRKHSELELELLCVDELGRICEGIRWVRESGMKWRARDGGVNKGRESLAGDRWVSVAARGG
jgi:hypothetical protein